MAGTRYVTRHVAHPIRRSVTERSRLAAELSRLAVTDLPRPRPAD